LGTVQHRGARIDSAFGQSLTTRAGCRCTRFGELQFRHERSGERATGGVAGPLAGGGRCRVPHFLGSAGGCLANARFRVLRSRLSLSSLCSSRVKKAKSCWRYLLPRSPSGSRRRVVGQVDSIPGAPVAAGAAAGDVRPQGIDQPAAWFGNYTSSKCANEPSQGSGESLAGASCSDAKNWLVNS
jgi:hypothetical protein